MIPVKLSVSFFFIPGLVFFFDFNRLRCLMFARLRLNLSVTRIYRC